MSTLQILLEKNNSFNSNLYLSLNKPMGKRIQLFTNKKWASLENKTILPHIHPKDYDGWMILQALGYWREDSWEQII